VPRPVGQGTLLRKPSVPLQYQKLNSNHYSSALTGQKGTCRRCPAAATRAVDLCCMQDVAPCKPSRGAVQPGNCQHTAAPTQKLLSAAALPLAAWCTASITCLVAGLQVVLSQGTEFSGVATGLQRLSCQAEMTHELTGPNHIPNTGSPALQREQQPARRGQCKQR
jgi:hypothetical protein